jgi:hypothetical protein
MGRCTQQREYDACHAGSGSRKFAIFFKFGGLEFPIINDHPEAMQSKNDPCRLFCL